MGFAFAMRSHRVPIGTSIVTPARVPVQAKRASAPPPKTGRRLARCLGERV